MATKRGTSGNDVLRGTNTTDRLFGYGGNDSLFGYGGSDLLIGGSGDDRLNGGTGSDDLRGGAGNDVYWVDHDGDINRTVVDSGNDTVRSEISYTLGSQQERLILTGTAGIRGTGHAGDNFIRGNAGSNRLAGLGGNDQLLGSAGNDLLIGGSGNDRLNGGAGNDDLRGGPGNDIYWVNHGGDINKTLVDIGNDTVLSSISYTLGEQQERLLLTGSTGIRGTGHAGDDFIRGNAGSNRLVGLGGDDQLLGGAGNDVLIGSSGDDRLDGGTGNDTLSGSVGADTLLGGAGNDVLVYDPTDVAVDGGDGTDTLHVNGAGRTVDLTDAPAFSSIEVVNLSGVGANTLIIDSAALLAVSSDTHTLRVEGDADDTVLTPEAWSLTRQVTIGGQQYDEYANGGATLRVPTSVAFHSIVMLDGRSSADDAGWAVGGGGDVNGDGFHDILIGAPDAPGPFGRGEAYLIYGGPDTAALPTDLGALDGSDGSRFVYTGPAPSFPLTDNFGQAVANARDFNGDGYADILVGAPFAQGSGALPNAGIAFAIFASPSGFGTEFSVPSGGSGGFQVAARGAPYGEWAGYAVASAGDVNADGFDDLIAGAPGTNWSAADAGSSRVMLGYADTGYPALGGLFGGYPFTSGLMGEAADDNAGLSVDTAGDVNGDGIADLIVGAPKAASGDSGAAYVVFGTDGDFSISLALSALDGTNGFRLVGAAAGDYAGVSVSGAGDVNGDGIDDLIVGASYNDAGGANAGAAYVVFGRTTGFGADLGLGSLDGSNGFRLTGETAGDLAGWAVDSAGDIDGDGFDDLIVGARGATGGAGAAYVIFGKDTGFAANVDLGTLSATDGFRLDGAGAGDDFGRSVSGAGDVNGDGFDDVLIGAPSAETAAGSTGRAYLLLGKDYRGAVGFVGTDGDDLLTGTSADEVLIGGRGDDTLDGAAGADLLNGAAGDDILVFDAADRGATGGTGFDTLRVDGAGVALDLTAMPAYDDIEAIDLTGSGDNSLIIDPISLLNVVGESRTLRVTGDTGDTVASTAAWGRGSASIIDGQPFTEYYVNNVRLQILDGVVFDAPMNALRLDALDGTNGFRLDGDANGDAVAFAGDVNGDGFDDLIIGEDKANPNANMWAGESHVVFGQPGGFAATLDLATLDGSNGFRLDGIDAFDRSGVAVGSAGDVNGDGLDDIILGASGADPSGESYVVFGQTSGFPASINLAALDGTNGFRLDGATPSRAVSAGDINTDGLDDIILASNNDAFIVFGDGNGFGASIDLAALNGDDGFRVGAAGHPVSVVGDVNGDGRDDLVVGGSHVVFGRSAFGANLDLANLDGSNGFALSGGGSATAAGDINGDGFDDVIVSSPSTAGRGESYVLFGHSGSFAATIDLANLDSTNGFRISGNDPGDDSGTSVAAGDINGDGYDDLVIGAPGADAAGRENAGETYIIFGKSSGFAPDFSPAALDGTNGVRIDGFELSLRTGAAVAADGDIDGDGFDDVLVDSGTGTSYLVLGSTFAGAIDVLGTEADEVLVGTPAADVIVAGRGDDTLDGAAGADVLKGGAGNDILLFDPADFRVEGDSGEDTLRLTGAGEVLDLPSVDNNRFTGIEILDLTGTGDNAVSLNIGEILALSDTNVLRVDGDAGDSVGTRDYWMLQPGGPTLIGSDLYHTYRKAGVSLLVDTDIEQSGVTLLPQLETLDGSNGFRLDGIVSHDYSGHSVASAGDINGDGFSDVIIGAWGADPGGDDRAGQSYVVFGQATGFAASQSLGSLDGTNGFRIDGIDPVDESGRSVASAGDINGDGLDDLIVGAFLASPDSRVSAGESYVIFGRPAGFATSLDLASLDGSNGFRLDGAEAGDFSGERVAAAGDVNGDGFDDLVIAAAGADPGDRSAAGASFVVFGNAGDFGATLDLGTLDGRNGFRLEGIDAGDYSGHAVAAAGDINGDGIGDIVVGADEAWAGGDQASGETYVIFGTTRGFDASINLGTLDGTNGFRIDGVDAFDFSGRAAASAGDINGDGFDDLIIGAAYGDPGGADAAGESYVVFGKSSGFAASLDLATLNGGDGFRINGAAASDRSGYSVAGAGDINGDGFDDLLVTAPYAAGGGVTYVVFGRSFGFGSTLDLANLDEKAGLRLEGIDPLDRSGYSAAGAGDVNGDGFDDLVIGAFHASPGGNTLAGETYIVFGADFRNDVDFLGGDGDDVLTGTAADEIFIGGRGSDIVDGGPGSDVLIGAAGDDTFVFDFDDRRVYGGGGEDTLRIDGAGVIADLTGTPDYDSLEVVDLRGSGDNTLLVDALSILNISGDTHTLRVIGDAGDVVDSADIWLSGDPTEIDGQVFKTFTVNNATLLVHEDVTVDTLHALNLGGLDGVNGFRLPGAQGNAGTAVASAGDVNGDGFADIIIGEPFAQPYEPGDPVLRNSAGETHVVFGKAGPFEAVLPLDSLDGSNGFRLDGIDSYDFSGRSVASAGDINGDGFDDVIIGAHHADPGGDSSAGESYVVFGSSTGFPAKFQLDSLDGSNGFRLDGIDAYDGSGIAVASAGDINGDGIDDIVIGAFGAEPGDDFLAIRPGETYVVFGRTSGFDASLDLAALDGDNGFRFDGIEDGERGPAVASAGDVNGDGIGDLIVSAETAGFGATDGAGESYVLFGRTSGYAAQFDPTTIDGLNGFRLVGIDYGDRSGVSVGSAGDVNGDGYGDLLIGAFRGDPGGRIDAGESYVIFGQAAVFGASFDLSTLDGGNGFRIDGVDPGDFSGFSSAPAGDVNGDGFDDIMIGAHQAAPGGQAAAGETYVLFGKASGFGAAINLADLDGKSGFRIDGVELGGNGGQSLASAGDVNGDGFDDIVIGAPNVGANRQGESYLVFGKNFTGASEADDALTGTAADESLVGGLGNDTLDGAAGADVLKGGAGNDFLLFDPADFRVEGDSGEDTLQFTGASESLDLTALDNKTFTGIEIVDLTGTGNNALNLNILDLLALSDTNTLRIDGNAGDAVSTTDDWTLEAGGPTAIGMEFYNTYTQMGATLLIDTDIDQTGVNIV